MKILLLEDDFLYQESIKDFLESLGYFVQGVSDGNIACDLIMKNTYHLFILDIKVPNINGHEVIQYIRSLEIKTPIIIISSLVDIQAIVKSYEFGCNEYLKKPFELMELKIRLEQVLKNYYGYDENNIIIAKNFTYNIQQKILKNNTSNISINLTQKEIKIIDLMLSNKSFINIEAIRNEIWEDNKLESTEIRVYIKRIRDKTSNDFIISSRGLGYKINVT